MTVEVANKFDPAQFLTDFKKTADAIGAFYSESSIRGTLKTFKDCFQDSAVIWRTTNRDNGPVNYRFYLRRRLDTIDIATKAGYLEPDNQMARLITSWSALYNGHTEQWCDFHPETGLAKTWVNLKGRRQVDDILNAPEVPDSVRAHGPTFYRLGLKLVRFLAADYEGSTMNLYFTAPGPVSETQAAQYTGLAQCKPPTEQEFRNMHSFLNPQGFAFAVTMEYETRAIKRVAFYALNLPENQLPAVNDRVLKFFAEAPSYDKQQTKNVAWSFGLGDNKYMKAESSYVGELATVLRDVGSPLTSL
ncbi:hypothetical protein EYZ11_005279 [Aspergillus tanneri]|uniref:Aromatic prenyltransferase n=1 Tax=Aspergillus tanneri TaxID=1220188 RepID=A0A4S3JIY7_9EURO|nr:putative secondary metabolism biosynthetic enzyme [Aspergillus tanneri]KAA8647038.1 putative secondary metabolism biosynthetic enzyme [Aspergillus tanneri]THC95240.1 hypothetical protein EYZ11_005279 [Aspergillus tanneri]